MARPIKSGLDYFPLDVNFYEDDKISLITAEFGIAGEAVVVRLLSKIYKNGYFYTWGVDERLLFCRWAGGIFRPDQVEEVVKGCLRRSVFDEQVFKMFGVLTSIGIQKRYMQAVNDRVEIPINSDYWLIDLPKNAKKTVSRRETDVNRLETEDNPPDNTQSKVKESKSDEIKGEKIPRSPYYSKFDFQFLEDWAKDSFRKWLVYKLAREEAYTTQLSIEQVYKRLTELSGKNSDLAIKIVDNVIEKNAKNLFLSDELKTKSDTPTLKAMSQKESDEKWRQSRT